MRNGMESVNITYENIIGIPGADLLRELSKLYIQLFDDADLDFFKKRIRAHEDIFTVIARNEGQLIGFKMGYPILDNTFYSWIGGVIMPFRNKGIANRLAQIQEDWVKENKFAVLKTKSMNRFKPMMMLNLKRGFDITKVYTNEKGQTKIVFRKSIT